MALTEEQRLNREGKINASFTPYLMAGDGPKLVQEWMRLVGHPDYVEEDLSRVWRVQYGSWIEPLAIDWHQAMTGQPLIYRGRSCTHPTRPYVGCTLDCFYEQPVRTAMDVKAPGRFRKIEDVLSFYPAQLVVQKACIGAERTSLLIVHGGDEPVEHEVTWDADYEQEVWDRIDWFWGCVENLACPAALPAAKVSQPAVRVVDMSQSNSWSEFAGIWLRTKDPARAFADAARGLKDLVEPDVAKAHGHGVCVFRSKAGSLTIKESQK
jgi:hypothetical protein